MAVVKDIKIIDDKICCTSKALYELLDIAESTLVRWGQDGCPKIARGWWALQDVLKWRGLIGGGGVKTNGAIKKLSLQEQKLIFEVKLKEAQSEATELKNSISKGDYIPKTEIVSELQRYFLTFKRSLQGISRKIAMELSPLVGQVEARRMEKLSSDILNDALLQLSISGIYDIKEAKKATKETKDPKGKRKMD